MLLNRQFTSKEIVRSLCGRLYELDDLCEAEQRIFESPETAEELLLHPLIYFIKKDLAEEKLQQTTTEESVRPPS